MLVSLHSYQLFQICWIILQWDTHKNSSCPNAEIIMFLAHQSLSTFFLFNNFLVCQYISNNCWDKMTIFNIPNMQVIKNYMNFHSFLQYELFSPLNIKDLLYAPLEFIITLETILILLKLIKLTNKRLIYWHHMLNIDDFKTLEMGLNGIIIILGKTTN